MAAIVDDAPRSLSELLRVDTLWLQERVHEEMQVQKSCPQVHCPVLMLRRLLDLTYDVTLTIYCNVENPIFLFVFISDFVT